jgi:hypothetical protein
MNRIASLGIPVKGYTDASDEDVEYYKSMFRPVFEVIRVSTGVFVDSGVTSVPTIDWFTKDRVFRTVGYKKYLLEDGTLDLSYETSTSKKESACGK